MPLLRLPVISLKVQKPREVLLGPLGGSQIFVPLMDLVSLLLDLVLHLSEQVGAVLNGRRYYRFDSLVQLCQQATALIGKGENDLDRLQGRVLSASFSQLAFKLLPCASAEYLVLAGDEGFEAVLEVREAPFLLVDHLQSSLPSLLQVSNASFKSMKNRLL